MKILHFSIIMMSVFVISLAFTAGAFAQNDSTFKYDPTLQYGSKPQTPAETPEQLHKKLVNARDAISNIMGSKMGDIPFNEVGVDEVNSILDVGIDSSKATLSEAQYLKKIKEIVGDIPIKITFGQISSLPLILTNNPVPRNNASASSNVMKSSGPVVIILESPLKQFRMGNFAQGVQCNTGLQLFFKAEDYTPVCAHSGTATVLLKRGWATTHPPEPFVKKIAITGLLQNYTIGQPINAMINYAGYYWYTEPDVKILGVNGTQIWFNCPYCYTRSTPLLRPSLDAFTYIVRDYASNNLPVINKTGTYTMIASLDNRTASAEFAIVKSLMSRAGDIAISYNNTLYNDGTFYVKQGQNFTLMLDVTSNPVNVPVTLYTAPHSGYTKTNGIDFKLSYTRVNTPAKVMWYMSVSKDATPTTYGATVRLNDTDGMGSVTYLFHVTVK